jgi:hypothetical protein
MKAQAGVALLALVLVLGIGAQVSGAASSKIPARWRSCKAVNVRYPHGVGKVGAHDATTGEPVTNFTHSNYLYRLAMRYNRGLDRDKDGIACEKL